MGSGTAGRGVRRIRDLGAWGTGAGAAGAVAVALLLAIAPGALARTPTTVAAPYTGSTVSFSNSTSAYGTCASSAKLSSLAWSATTGVATAVATAKASGCATPPLGDGDSSSDSGTGAEIAIPVHVAAGAHNFTLAASYAYTIDASATGHYACARAHLVAGTFTENDCSWDVRGSATWSFELYDATNGSALPGANTAVTGPQNFTQQANDSVCNGVATCTWSNGTSYCTDGMSYTNCVPAGTANTGTSSSWLNTGKNCASAYMGSCLTWKNWTLVGSHHYWLLVMIDIEVSADVSNYPGGHAAMASLNAATGGNTGWKISSVKVT